MSLLVLGACDLKRELVGETLPDAGSSGSASSDSTDGTSATTTDGQATGAPDGAPCEFGPPEVWEEGSMPPGPDTKVEYGGGPIVMPGPTCAGDVCLYGMSFEPPNCEDDAACAGDERFSGACGEFGCEIDEPWAKANTTCTRLCEVDTDCPVIPGCNDGPVCTPISKLGSLCCQKVCGCRDDLYEGFLATIAAECNSGQYCQ